MSKKHPNTRQVTVHLDDDLAQLVDQTMINFGLESKSAAICMMARGFSSMFPEETTVYVASQEATKAIRKFEFESLAEYFETRAKVARASAQ